jgi:hypothetical protein
MPSGYVSVGIPHVVFSFLFSFWSVFEHLFTGTFYCALLFEYLLIKYIAVELPLGFQFHILGFTSLLRTRDTPPGPPSTPAEFFRRTCLHSNLQTSPQTPKNAYAKFQNPKTTFCNYPPPPYYTIFFGCGILIHWLHRALCKVSES